MISTELRLARKHSGEMTRRLMSVTAVMFAFVVPLLSKACSPKKRGAFNRDISTSGHSGSFWLWVT